MMSEKWIGLICILCAVLLAVLGITPTRSGAEEPASGGTLLSALRQVPVFQRLDDSRLRKVAEVVGVSERQGGELIIEQGKRLGKMFIALDSEVQIKIDRKPITVLPKNSLVGEIEFLEDVPATADVVLMRKSRVISLGNADLRRVMDADPVIGYLLMYEIAKMEANRLRMNNQRKQK